MVVVALAAGSCSIRVDDRVTLDAGPVGDQPAPSDIALVDELSDPPAWADVTIFEAAGVRSYRERLHIEGPGFSVDNRSDATAAPWGVSQQTTTTDGNGPPSEDRLVATAAGIWAQFDGTRDWYEERFFAYEAGLGLGRLADGRHIAATLSRVGDGDFDGRAIGRYRGDPADGDPRVDWLVAGISERATAQFEYWIDDAGLVLRLEGIIADGADRYLYQYDLFGLGAELRIDAPDPADVVVFD